MRRRFLLLPLLLVSSLLVACNHKSDERRVCEKGRAFLLATVGDLMAKLTPAEIEEQLALCVEDILKLKSGMTPEAYDEMIQCALEAKDVPTYSRCGMKPPSPDSPPRPAATGGR